jgi:hypothetical protein
MILFPLLPFYNLLQRKLAEIWRSPLPCRLIPIPSCDRANLSLVAGNDMAPVIGVVEVLCCGNIGVFGIRHNSSGNSRELVPKEAIDICNRMASETVLRGEQAGGALVMAKDRSGQTVFIGHKAVNPKRGNLIKILGSGFAWERRKKESSGCKPLPDHYIMMMHVRFATSGPPTLSETHPHHWTNPTKVLVWQIDESTNKWEKQSKLFSICITHNGDFDAWKLYGNLTEIKNLRPWLNKVLDTDNHTEGDSPVIAGMLLLLTTQGMWYESVRLAWLLKIASSIEDRVPKQQWHKWAKLFERNFIQFGRSLEIRHPDPNVHKRHINSLIEKLLQETADDSSMSQWSLEKRKEFITTAVRAFLHNDLVTATKIFMSRAVGSFGLVAASTLEEKLVVVAKGQQMFIGFNPAKQQVFYASSPVAIDRALGYSPGSYRLDLDHSVGEIAVLDRNAVQDRRSIKIYSITNADIALDISNDRWITMAEEPFLHYTHYLDYDTKDPIGDELQRIPRTMSESSQNWQKGNLNRIAGDYFLELLIEKGHKFEQRRQTMQQAGLPADELRSSELDILVIGQENSLQAGHNFVNNLKKIFPKLNVQAISSNEALLKLKHDPRSLSFSKETIVLAITQSGQTFPTNEVIDECCRLYQKRTIREIFVLIGDTTSIVRSPVLRKSELNKSLPKNVFVSGSPHSICEAATITHILERFTLNKLVLFLAKHTIAEFPNSNPWGTILIQEDIANLEGLQECTINAAENIVGTDRAGDKSRSRIHKELVTSGRKWAQHVVETPTAWGIMALYIAITVGGKSLLGLSLSPPQAILNLFVAVFHISQNSAVFRILNYYAVVADITIYVFGYWFCLLGLRFWQKRTLLARTGTRSVVIGDVPCVHKPLVSYVREMFSLSFGINTLIVHGEDPADELLDYFGPQSVRGNLMYVGVPDGSGGGELQDRKNAVIMAAKQANNIRHLNVGPEIVALIKDPEIEDERCFSKKFILPRYNLKLNCKGPNASDRQKLIVDLTESMDGELVRLIAGYVFFWALAKDVASFPFLKFEFWKSQSRTKDASTASPVAGITANRSHLSKDFQSDGTETQELE